MELVLALKLVHWINNSKYQYLILEIIVLIIKFCSIWPQFVKDRIKTTYMYFGGSLAVTAASALAAIRSPAVMNIVMKNGFIVSGKVFQLYLIFCKYFFRD